MPSVNNVLYPFEVLIAEEYKKHGARSSRKSIWIRGNLIINAIDYVLNMYKNYTRFCSNEQTTTITGSVINSGSYDGFRQTIYLLNQLKLIQRVDERELPLDMIIPGRGAAHTGQMKHYYMLARDEPDIPLSQLPLEWKNPLKELARLRGYASMR